MRLQFTLLQLSAIVLAEQQQPLGDKIKGWFDKAASYIPTAAPSIPNPIHAASAKVAEHAVTPLTRDNWKQTLRPGPPSTTGEPDEWLVYVFGGNDTCYGRCDNATLAWNNSAALFSASSKGPKLASMDCEKDNVLCTLWGASPPSIYHILLPHAANADPVLRYVALNTSSVTATEIQELSTKRGFESIEPYTGIWNPFTGILATTGLNLPLAYVLAAFAKMPSWLPMVLVSLLSRTFMKRQAPQPAPRPAPAAQ